MAEDLFALFAKMADGDKREDLVVPEPIPHEVCTCLLEEGL